MAFGAKKFRIRVQKFPAGKKRGARVGLVSEKRIKVNGQTVKPGQGQKATGSAGQLRSVVAKRTRNGSS